jgi:NADH-quinone oxidoreductase subunit C
MRQPQMEAKEILTRLEKVFGEKIVGTDAEALDPWVEITPDSVPEVCRWLRDEPEMRFNLLNCISGVDYFQPDEKKAKKTEWEPHFEVLYHLSSLVHKHLLTLRVALPRWKDDAQGRLPEIPSVTDLWSTAIWHEREVFDLSGVQFVGHPDLRRILCPEDWEGHPLRKDYELPDEYHGIRTK